MKQIEANNLAQLKKELASKNIDVADLNISTSVNEDDAKNFHVVLIKTRPDTKNNQFFHTATVQQFNPVVFDRIERNIGNGFNHVGILHDPRKEVKTSNAGTQGSDKGGNKEEGKNLNVGQMVEKIKTITNVEELEAILNADNRQGVVKAVNERLEELVQLSSKGGNEGGEGNEGNDPQGGAGNEGSQE